MRVIHASYASHCSTRRKLEKRPGISYSSLIHTKTRTVHDAMSNTQASVAVNGLYKIFGGDRDQALSLLEQGRHKDDIFADTGITVGVHDASFTVNPGEVFVIMGLSGSGKSTLLRMINRLIEPTAGQVLLHGQDVSKLSQKDLVQLRRREMAMVFQSFALMEHLKVWENVAFGLEVAGVHRERRRTRAMDTLDQVGLKPYAETYPDQLSGGMRQRVGLARALAVEPSVMLMDEAFSALDPLIRAEMQDELLRLQRDSRRSVIFISHDLNEAMRIGDRIAIMQAGAIVQIDTPKNILHKPANDFVRSFFRGVDLTEIYLAGDIARRDEALIIDAGTTDLRGLLPRLRGAEHQVGYVCGTERRFIGMVSVASLMQAVESNAASLDAALLDTQPVAAGSPLSGVIQAAAQSDQPVPVVDNDGAFRGAISHAQLLQTLNQKPGHEH